MHPLIRLPKQKGILISELEVNKRKRINMNEEIINNIVVIQERIKKACNESGRNTDEVKLLLATKTVPVKRIQIALQAGQTLIAENKVKELKEKYD